MAKKCRASIIHLRETARVLRGPHSHTCQPTDKDLLNRYAVVDGWKWKELRERRLTPSQAVRELELSKDTTEVPTRNQAKYQLEKTPQRRLSNRRPDPRYTCEVFEVYSELYCRFAIWEWFRIHHTFGPRTFAPLGGRIVGADGRNVRNKQHYSNASVCDGDARIRPLCSVHLHLYGETHRDSISGGILCIEGCYTSLVAAPLSFGP